MTAKTIALSGGPQEQAALLQNFRADSIVEDCEAIRRNLTRNYPSEKKKWTIMGQSFGGFCCVHYLSKYPESLQEVFTTGGLPPLVEHPDIVYEQLLKKIKSRNAAYYSKYPEDVSRVKNIIRYIQNNNVSLPSGGKLSVLRLRQLGMDFGFHGGIDVVHEMICRLTTDLNHFDFFTRPTLAQFEEMQPFDKYPLYALMHQPLYARRNAPNWSADRVLKRHPEFMHISLDDNQPVLFTGEMVFRDMYNDYDELRPLLATADILESKDDWPELYDEAKLAKNEVPVYSASFIEDMYVDFDLARETASKINNCKTFVTNVLYHDALVNKTDELMKHLFALRDDVID
ncbi:hypothetical protein ACLMJK_007960 [Lecanora helva]